MKYESNEEKIFCNMNPRKKCNSLIWISLLQCFLSSSKLYNQIGEHYWRVCHSLQSCHTAQKLDRREYRARYEPRLAPKIDHSYIMLAHFWNFSDPLTHPLGQHEYSCAVLTVTKNGFLLPKLFWPTVRKIFLVIEKNLWNSRLKAENLQTFLDHLNNLFKLWRVRTISGNRMLF